MEISVTLFLFVLCLLGFLGWLVKLIGEAVMPTAHPLERYGYGLTIVSLGLIGAFIIYALIALI